MNIYSFFIRSTVTAVIVATAVACPAQQIKLELKFHRIGPVAYLPLSAEVTLTNLGPGKIELLPSTNHYELIHFEVEGGDKLPCDSPPWFDERVPVRVDLESVKSGNSLKTWEPGFALENNVMAPGHYRVRAIFDSRDDSSFRYFRFAPGHTPYRGYAESPWVDLTLDPPQGEDLHYFDEVMKRDGNGQIDIRCQLATGFRDLDLIDKYPGAYYAASMFTSGTISKQYSDSIFGYSDYSNHVPITPEKIHEFIVKGNRNILQSNSLPDTPDAAKDSRYIKWARAFLQSHPAAPVAPFVRLQLALHLYFVGEKAEAETLMKSLAAAPSGVEADWARRYLAIASPIIQQAPAKSSP